ncbi:hypothetical protein MUK42_19864, partial [Musa troglodytarum]
APRTQWVTSPHPEKKDKEEEAKVEIKSGLQRRQNLQQQQEDEQQQEWRRPRFAVELTGLTA